MLMRARPVLLIPCTVNRSEVTQREKVIGRLQLAHVRARSELTQLCGILCVHMLISMRALSKTRARSYMHRGLSAFSFFFTACV